MNTDSSALLKKNNSNRPVRYRSVIYSMSDRAFFAGGSASACDSRKRRCWCSRLSKAICFLISCVLRWASFRIKLRTCNTCNSERAQFIMDKTTPGSAVFQLVPSAHTNANETTNLNAPGVSKMSDRPALRSRSPALQRLACTRTRCTLHQSHSAQILIETNVSNAENTDPSIGISWWQCVSSVSKVCL